MKAIVLRLRWFPFPRRLRPVGLAFLIIVMFQCVSGRAAAPESSEACQACANRLQQAWDEQLAEVQTAERRVQKLRILASSNPLQWNHLLQEAEANLRYHQDLAQRLHEQYLAMLPDKKKQQQTSAISKQEQERINQEQEKIDAEARKIAQTYDNEKIRVPTPAVGKSEIRFNGIQVRVSDKVSHLVQFVKDKTKNLPQPTRERIRNAVFKKIVDHFTPEEGQLRRDMISGTAGDDENLLESLKGTISALGSPDPNAPVTKSEEASEAVGQNTRHRVSKAAKDKVIGSIKDEIDKLMSSSPEAPDK